MIRKHLVVVFILLIVVGFSACASPSGEEPLNLAETDVSNNSYTDWSSLDEAEIAIGFNLGIPELIGDIYQAERFRTYAEGILEAVYYYGDYIVYVRKVPGEGIDCSLDGTNYSKTHAFTRNTGTVTFYTNESYMDESHVGKTIIDYCGYSWALVTPYGFWGDSSVCFLDAIFG